ncbi:MAG: 50S ribosomal protein L21 [Actinomycetota bacterium]
MYAVIRAGGKQHKVAQGDVIEVERYKNGEESVDFTPLLVVEDNGTVRSGKDDLSGAIVSAKVLGEHKGKKIEVYKYKNKTGYRRHLGHRQRYSHIEISGISLTKEKSSSKRSTKKKEEEASS